MGGSYMGLYMGEKPIVSEAKVGDCILITEPSHTGCLAIDREDIPQLIEELKQYERFT